MDKKHITNLPLNNFKIICKTCENEAYIQQEYIYDSLGNTNVELKVICEYCQGKDEEITTITYQTEY